MISLQTMIKKSHLVYYPHKTTLFDSNEITPNIKKFSHPTYISSIQTEDYLLI